VNLITDQPEAVGQWVKDRAGGGKFERANEYALGAEKDGVLIAGVLFNNHYSGYSVQVHMAVESPYAGRQFLKAVFDYAFSQLKVQKLIGTVQENNLSARRLDEHLGFMLESRIEGACAGGAILLYTMTRAQCRFIKDLPCD